MRAEMSCKMSVLSPSETAWSLGYDVFCVRNVDFGPSVLELALLSSHKCVQDAGWVLNNPRPTMRWLLVRGTRPR